MTLRHGAEARLVTAMTVREDSMTLYGFAGAQARDLSSTLIRVSNVEHFRPVDGPGVVRYRCVLAAGDRHTGAAGR